MPEMFTASVQFPRWTLATPVDLWDVVNDLKFNPESLSEILAIQRQGWRGLVQFQDDPVSGETAWELELHNAVGLSVIAHIGDVIVLTNGVLTRLSSEEFTALYS